MIQSPQTQSFGLWFAEDLTAGSETSDQAKPESCVQFGETTGTIYLQTWEGSSSSLRQLGPQQWKCKLAPSY